MKIEKKLFKREEKRSLKETKAIIFHWPAGNRVPNVDKLWDWMDKKSFNSYHFFVSKARVIQTRETYLRAIHCGHSTYRKRAKEYFGERVCSNKDSPNNYTLAICMIHDNDVGGYSSETMNTAVRLTAKLCIEHGIDSHKDLLRHSDITNEKAIHCPRGFYEDDEDPDDLWNSFKDWVSEEISLEYEKLGIER